jgi:hypothetical protein
MGKWKDIFKKSMSVLELLFIFNTIVMNDGNDEKNYNTFYINLHL